MNTTTSQAASATLRSTQTATPIGLWFDMQAAQTTPTNPPLWATELAQLHLEGRVAVYAHSQSLYSQWHLPAHAIHGSLWPDDTWLTQITQILTQTSTQPTQQIVLLLPYRASPILWSQWALVNLGKAGGALDNMTGLLHGIHPATEELHRPQAQRWLILDRVISYGAHNNADSFAPLIADLTPLATWVHEGFFSTDALCVPLKAYYKHTPLHMLPIKKDQLSNHARNKVVYLSTNGILIRQKLLPLLESWRHEYSHQIIRMWAAFCVEPTPENSGLMLLTTMQHLWALQPKVNYSGTPPQETRVWLVGDGLNAKHMQAQLNACCVDSIVP